MWAGSHAGVQGERSRSRKHFREEVKLSNCIVETQWVTVSVSVCESDRRGGRTREREMERIILKLMVLNRVHLMLEISLFGCCTSGSLKLGEI